jgi:iron(III) transport system substrate-binding protein
MKNFFWLCILLLPLALALRSSSARDAEEVLGELNRLSPKEREMKFVEEAKKEGALNWYGNIEIITMGRLNDGFQKKYPFIKAQYFRGSGVKLINRILMEARQKKFEVDVFFLPFEFLPGLTKEKLLGRYSSPERAFYAPNLIDKEGYWAAAALNYANMAYNSKLVPRAGVPKSYDELLDPKWAGEVSIDMEPDRALLGWLKVWGEKKTEAFLNGLIKNKVVVRRGHTLQTELLCAGEFKVASELYAYQVTRMKREKGCPVDVNYANPVSASITPLSLARQAPHPYVAALFVDFVLSEEGQEIIVETGRIPTRKGVKAKYEEVSNLEGKGVPVVIVTPEDGEKWQSVSNRLVEILRK